MADSDPFLSTDPALLKEVEDLAKGQGLTVTWNEKKWGRVSGIDPINGRPIPDNWPFSPPEILRRTLLPRGHPDAPTLLPGSADNGTA